MAPYSPIWKYFSRLENGTSAVCVLCRRVISYSSSTSNLKKHLLKKHEQAYEEMKKLPVGMYKPYKTTSKADGILAASKTQLGDQEKKRGQTRHGTYEKTDKSSGPKKSSPYWNHYTILKNGVSANCHHCGKDIAYSGTSGSNLKKHLERKHPEVYTNMGEKSEVQESSDETDNVPKFTIDEVQIISEEYVLAEETANEQEKAPSEEDDSEGPENEQVESERYHLKWDLYQQSIHLSFANLYKNDRFADVMLITCNGDENYTIPAHKMILATSSLYFANIFDKTTIPPNAITYIVLPPDLTYVSIQVLLQYMYTGESIVSNDILDEVFRGGEMLKIRGLWGTDGRKLSGSEGYTREAVSIASQTSRIASHSTPVVPTNRHVVNDLPGTPSKSSPSRALQQIRRLQSKQIPTTAASHSVHMHKGTLMKRMPRTESSEIIGIPHQQSSSMHAKADPGTNKYDEEASSSEPAFSISIIGTEEYQMPSTSTEEPVSPPLNCELCSASFTMASEWVRHVETHSATTEISPKRPRRAEEIAGTDQVGPLRCDLCNTYYITPADYIRHIQSTHSERELTSQKIRAFLSRRISPKTRCCCQAVAANEEEASATGEQMRIIFHDPDCNGDELPK